MVSVTWGSWGFLGTLLGDVASRLPANGMRGVMNSFCINPGRLRNKDAGTKGAGWAGTWRHGGHRCGGRTCARTTHGILESEFNRCLMGEGMDAWGPTCWKEGVGSTFSFRV